MLRAALYPFSVATMVILKPVKLFAWRTRSQVVRRFLLTLTKPVDFALIWANVQNPAMLMHWRRYRGNFLFGDAVMVTDHATTVDAIARPSMRCNNFMGLNIVASDSGAFATNSGILNQCPPVRRQTRDYLDRAVFTERVQALDLDTVRGHGAEALSEWAATPRMADAYQIRGVVTRVFLKLLSGVDVPAEEAEWVTRQYIRRFVELSLFGRYLQFMGELLGTRKAIRRDAYLRLQARGIDPMVVDITLFAAMFSVGTLVLRCVEDVRRFNMDYAGLTTGQKRRLIIEAVRLFPTVTSVHRIVEKEECVEVCGRRVRLTPGDEVAYPFVCANRDPARFEDPEELRLDRSEAEYDAVLSWSWGPHSCPAKELSILVTHVMLDKLAERFDLRTLRISNPAF